MCFSAEADFVSGAVIGVIGVVTLTKVEKPRELALGMLPLAFALHQIIEGFVWQSLSDPAPHTGDGVAVRSVPLLMTDPRATAEMVRHGIELAGLETVS